MKVIPTAIPDVLIFEPTVYTDHRGFFFESFNQSRFTRAVAQDVLFVQDNHSQSRKGVLRGLHYQLQEPQGKLVRVIHGEVFDVAVDIRRSSSTYAKWVGEILSAKNRKQFWLPEGFAHGYLVLSESAEILYKTTRYYAAQQERSIAWDDKDLNISWPLEAPVQLSERDRCAGSLAQADLFE